jgi:uncharacterized protein YbjT (DUF2867 family)
MKTYVITGATGHTGKPIALGLLERGHKVRIISRNPEKAKELTDKGAELFVGSTQDAEFLKRAFDGADAAYLMIPMDPAASDYTAMQVSHAQAMADGLKGSSIKHVATLSSVGAHLPQGAGVVQGLERMEKILNALPEINVRHMRASYFIENTMMQAQTVKFMGVMATPVNGDLKIPMVATKDIAAVGLKRLLDLTFSGKSHEYILGKRDVCYDEIAPLYGVAIGMPDLKYRTVSSEEAKNAMMMMGMSANVAEKMVEFINTMNEGRILGDVLRTPENSTPTGIEEFVPLFKAIYEN